MSSHLLTRFNKIAIPNYKFQMAGGQGSHWLIENPTILYLYSLPLSDIYILFLNIFTQLALTQSFDSLFHSFIKDVTKLQRVHNCLARVVTRSPHFSRSVPLLKSLHWLPVRYRIIFKICTITYQALSNKQPAYLHSMFIPARQPRQLRSSGSDLLSVPRVKTNAGTRVFSVATPTLWNSLHDSIKSARNIALFRRNLKTYHFKMAYPP